MQSRKNRLFRQLLVTTLLIGGTFNLISPVMAAGTKPGTSISNTATATYEDPTGTKLEATSNTVVITVAEVAGITNVGTGVTDVNAGSIQPNDLLYYNYTITNVGNDPTTIFIPSTATVSGSGTVSGAIQYSTDGGKTYNNVPSGGTPTGSVDVGGTVLVRVPVTVNSNAPSGNFISVILGDTGANDNSGGTQNQPDNNDSANAAAQAKDVRTIDNSGTQNGDTSGTPANGEREASAVEAAQIGSLPSLVNGPDSKADAIASTNNDDFTNKSAFIPAGTDPGTAYNPDVVTFTNTVKNTSTESGIVVALLPTVPLDKTSLPTGTQVTLSLGGATATYRYTGTAFEFVSGTGNSATGEQATTGTTAPISATNPTETAPLAAGGTASYTVTVDLPSSTQLVGYGVPITAFQDLNNDGLIGYTDSNADGTYSPGEETNPANTTIDRIYTGYLKLVKESRLLQGDGPTVSTADGTFSTAAKSPAPGNIVEYRITYTNVSTVPTGTNNITLSANKIVITENGTTGSNNWAKDNDGNGVIDTSNVKGSATDAKGSIAYSPSDQTGTTAATDVTQYVDTVTDPLAPNTSGTFTFQRKVN